MVETEKKTGIVKWVTKEIKQEAGQSVMSFTLEDDDKIWYKIYGAKEVLETMKNDMISSGNEISFIYEMGNATEFTLIKQGEKKKAFGGGYAPKESFEEKSAAFSVSYTKDLIVADKAKLEELETLSERIFKQIIALGKKK